MSQHPATLMALLAAWSLVLIAGLSLIWQAFREKAAPGKSRLRNYWNGVKFRFRFLTGALLIGLVVVGAVWFYLARV